MTLTELHPAELHPAEPRPPELHPAEPRAALQLAAPPLPAATVPALPLPALTFRALTGTTADRALVAALVRQSSPATLRSRFFLPAAPHPEDVLRTHLPYLLAGPPDGLALVALADGAPVGLLNLVAGPDRRLELGVLVTDDAQRRGIAGALLRLALRPDRWPGWTVRATVQPGNAAARALIRGHGARLISGIRGEYVFEFPLAA
jgi:RimJ/RimL family protein N-acetyltransferase